MYRKSKLLFVALIFLGCAQDKSVNTIESELLNTTSNFDGMIIQKQVEADTIKKSIKALAKAIVGDATISITYHSPAVRGRIIWGGLVPYDQVWVTGAHMATTFESSQDLIIGNTIVPAGKYGLFTIPSKDQWTFILNRNWQQHLADDYTESEDIIRVVLNTQVSDHQERLRYELIPDDSNTVSIIMHWEKIQFSLPMELK
jgi:Protein of unknown function (DUF2911)